LLEENQFIDRINKLEAIKLNVDDFWWWTGATSVQWAYSQYSAQVKRY